LVLLALLAVSVTSNEFVRTPNGLIPSECAYGVPAGTHIEHLDDNMGAKLHFPDGRIKTVGPCMAKLPPLDLQFEVTEKKSEGEPPAGWQVYTYWIGPSDITSFLGYWNTPDIPSNTNGQLLYLFTGLQNNCGGYGLCPNSSSDSPSSISSRGIIRTSDDLISAATNILQPVLQYGFSPAGGGEYWGMASWYVANIGTVYTSVSQVAPGDMLFGNMTKVEGTKNMWVIAFSDETNTKVTPTTLTVSKGTLTDTEPDAYVTLEVYTVSECNQYPTNTVQFTQMSIMESFTTPVTPDWMINTYSNACGEMVDIVNPTQVNIVW